MMSPGSSGHFPSNGRTADLVKLNGSQNQIQSHESEKRTCGGEGALIEMQKKQKNKKTGCGGKSNQGTLRHV